MIVHDKDHKDHYTRLYNRIPEDENLSVEAKGILWYLLTKPRCWRIYKKQLKEALKVPRWTFDRAWRELEKCGYIVRENHEWYAYETPQDAGCQHQESCENCSKDVAVQHRKMSAASMIDVGSQHLVTTEATTDSNNGKKKQVDQVATRPSPAPSRNGVLVDIAPHLPSDSANANGNEEQIAKQKLSDEIASNRLLHAEKEKQHQLWTEEIKRQAKEVWLKVPESLRPAPGAIPTRQQAMAFFEVEE